MNNLLQSFSHLSIDWDLTPEHAVTMYLEWGNNDWGHQFGPVTSKNDYSIYFVVDTWGESPVIRLIKRNTEDAIDLICFPLPKSLLPDFIEEFGGLKGVFAPTKAIILWLRQELEQEG